MGNYGRLGLAHVDQSPVKKLKRQRALVSNVLLQLFSLGGLAGRAYLPVDDCCCSRITASGKIKAGESLTRIPKHG